jgi:hypothetical protein
MHNKLREREREREREHVSEREGGGALVEQKYKHGPHGKVEWHPTVYIRDGDGYRA